MNESGIVFDIQRFSLHDGPGIRTTVFLKGCPLRCLWCHNPESWNTRPQLRFREPVCAACGRCSEACHRLAHRVGPDGHSVRFDLCDACGCCVTTCPTGALSLVGRRMDVPSVMAEVAADAVYYAQTGGGMTVSGGEPLLQFDFLYALLQDARARGIHTCVETCGYTDREKLEVLLGLVDLFLFDIKYTDEAAHIRYTGVSNRPILENLAFLCEYGASVRLRCPIVPDINDTDAHIRGVAALTRRFPELLGVDVLPYHNMGRDKWRQLGKEYSLMRLENPDGIEKECLLRRFRSAGCRDVSMQ